MAVKFTFKDRYEVKDLLEIMHLLRSPEGCPWDREQTHRSIRGDFLEETHEAIEAIDREDSDGLQEELGDVLLQVVFHAVIEEEAGGFNFDRIVDTLCHKLVSRHPHVFGDVDAQNATEALKNWDAIKRASHQGKTQAQLLDGVPHSLPALMRAGKVLNRAKRVGFVPALAAPDVSGDAKDIGEKLFSLVAFARSNGIDPEEALSITTNDFIDCFSEMEQKIVGSGKDVSAVTAEEWQKLWEETRSGL
jgi:tetrapyrrole methylase family protein/MazG family protein